MGQIRFRSGEIDQMVRVLRGCPRGLSVDAARERIAAELGLKMSPSALCHQFQAHGMQTPKWYIGRPEGDEPRPGLAKARSEPPPELDVPIDFEEEEAPRAQNDTEPAPPPEPEPARPPSFPPFPEHLTGAGDSGLGDERMRVIVPDSHGCYIDPKAAAAFLEDLKVIDPDEIVFLGDHVDVSGMYSAHPPNYARDLDYSYEADLASAEAFLDAIQRRAPRARGVYLEGNHEQHVERAIARTQHHARDALAQLDLQSPDKRLRLRDRGLRYVRMAECYDGLSIPGTVRLGKCHFTHGFSASKFATAQHVTRYGANVVHGHTHRVQEYGTRTVASDAIGGWSPGTLALLQPLYMHTTPTEWRHGYAIQASDRRGNFLHINIPIVNGWSGLKLILRKMKPLASIGAA